MPKPVLQALVLADHIYQDKFTGKMVIAGTFNRVVFVRRKAEHGAPPPAELLPPLDGPQRLQSPGELPPPADGPRRRQPSDEPPPPPDLPRRLQPHEVSRAGSPFAYVSLTEVHGTIPLELRYVDLDDNVVVLRTEFSVRSDSPLNTVEVMVQLPPLPTLHPGVFALELLSGNEPLGSHRVTAVGVDPPGPEHNPADEGA